MLEINGFRKAKKKSFATNSTTFSLQNCVNVVAKANRALGFVRRNIKSCSRETKLMCYITLIRPVLEYACSAWDPFLVSHINSLEMVQRRAARFILNDYDRDSSVSKMLENIGLNNLTTRRLKSRLALLYKIDTKLTPMDVPVSVKRKDHNGRTDNGKAYIHMQSHSNIFHNSFYVRTIRDWNALANEIVSCSSLESFVNKLTKV